MHVKKKTEKMYSVILTESESVNLSVIAKGSKVAPEKLIEHLLDSSLQTAWDQLKQEHEGSNVAETDNDGNEISGSDNTEKQRPKATPYRGGNTLG